MIDSHTRQRPDARQPAALNPAAPEPSHIHIPRPSRLAPSPGARPPEVDATRVQLACVEDAAA
ncbi:MAG: hypothetical protein JO352_14700 [Chloroflexi bacterium]|nr:hypothetical protein [Chloroflexota bacterium]MBV9596882.1 hypothetical protein [Chloroflexota bacterium]